MIRCIHCRGDCEAAHKFYGDQVVMYELASVTSGRTVIAHLRCTSVPSFEATDVLLATLLQPRKRAA